MSYFAELFELSATDVVLIVLFLYVVYKLFFKRQDRPIPAQEMPPAVPPLKRQDMTVEQLIKYNGIGDQHICMAICGKVYDVTKGKDFYGPGGAYEALAGHDATRALGAMDVTLVNNEYDDHADISASDLADAKEWEQRMAMKYPCVGRLLAPGEEPTDYETEQLNKESH